LIIFCNCPLQTDALRRVWKERNLPGLPLKLTFIVVAKKHHVRFFPKDKREETGLKGTANLGQLWTAKLPAQSVLISIYNRMLVFLEVS